MLDQLHSGMNYTAVGREFVLTNQQYSVNQVSLNRNTHTTRLGIDCWMKRLQPQARRNLTGYVP